MIFQEYWSVISYMLDCFRGVEGIRDGSYDLHEMLWVWSDKELDLEKKWLV